MRKRDVVLTVIVIVLLFYVVLNIGAINNFLTFATDKTIEMEHTQIVVPEAWNTTMELNITNESKTNSSISNGYVIYDFWEDWPESEFSDTSRSYFSSIEEGGYEALKEENKMMGGFNVSCEYFKNPSRDSDTQWDCIGINYVFSKEDTNYAIQVHYFTDDDYNNKTFIEELEDRTEDIISNIHNNEYDGFFSFFSKLFSLF